MHPFETHLLTDWPLDRWHDVGVLVAVSGGPDSVALLRALHAVAPSTRIVVGHFDHRLRGAESDADRDFVRHLARQFGLPFELGAGEPRQIAAGKDGIEAEARAERYAFLRMAAERVGARYVVTGHTADDQIETVLHRIVRDTGIAGLAGMKRVRLLSPATTLVRPILGCRRAEVLAYLEFLGQPFRHDSSNNEFGFTRNRLRHDLLPKIEREYNPSVGEALLRLSRLADEAQGVIQAAVETLAERALVVDGKSLSTDDGSRPEIGIDCRALAGQPPHLVRELFVRVWRDRSWPEQSMGMIEWERLANLCVPLPEATSQTRPGGEKIMLPGGILAQRRGDLLLLKAPTKH